MRLRTSGLRDHLIVHGGDDPVDRVGGHLLGRLLGERRQTDAKASCRRASGQNDRDYSFHTDTLKPRTLRPGKGKKHGGYTG